MKHGGIASVSSGFYNIIEKSSQIPEVSKIEIPPFYGRYSAHIYSGAQSFRLQGSDRTCDLIGTEAPCTHMYMADRPVNKSLDAFYVRLPHSVGAPVGMGNLNPESNALVTNFAFCHFRTSTPAGEDTRRKIICAA